MQGLLKVGGQVVKRHEKLRTLLKKNNVKLLEMCGAAPKWMRVGKNSEYPEDLVILSESWLQWAKKWRDFWDCFQIWNEPNHDGHKGNVTEFASLVKTIAWAAEQQDVKVTNGGFAFCDLNYIKQCKTNGMMDAISYISLHIYDNAASIPQIIKKYRLAVPDKQLWVTETSKGFNRKNLYSKRPDKSLKEELANCLDNARNVIECRAGGVARYYPFTLISWPTDKIQLQRRRFYANGCLGYHYTPLRYMAVYAQAVRMLSGKNYLGEIQSGTKPERFKVFADKRDAVMILTPAVKGNQGIYQLDKSLTGITVEEIDGRILEIKNNSIPLGHQLKYVKLSYRQFQRVFSGKIIATQKQKEILKPKKLSPVILQPFFKSTDKFAVTKNYLKLNKSAGQFNLNIKINNLSNKAQSVKLECQSSASFIVSNSKFSLSIPPQSTIIKAYQVKINPDIHCDVINESQITIKGTDSNGLDVLPISFAMRICSNNFADYRRKAREVVKVDLNNLRHWDTGHISKNGLMRIFLTPNKNLCIQAKFKNYRHVRTWAAPKYQISEYKDKLQTNSVIIVRGKLERANNNLQILLYEADGSRYETRLPINDKNNGNWQIMPVFFSDFQRSRGSWDENQNLDLDQVKTMAIGILCPHGGEMKDNRLTISDFVIIN